MKIVVFQDEAGTLCRRWIISDAVNMEECVPRDKPYIAFNTGDVICIEDPKDNYTRAWTITDGSVKIDIKKARDIRLEVIRHDRDNRLKMLDTQYIIAHSKNDVEALKEISETKQRLRDMPASLRTALDNAMTTYDLDHIVPPDLI